jgi:hypothetical protein
MNPYVSLSHSIEKGGYSKDKDGFLHLLSGSVRTGTCVHFTFQGALSLSKLLVLAFAFYHVLSDAVCCILLELYCILVDRKTAVLGNPLYSTLFTKPTILVLN